MDRKSFNEDKPGSFERCNNCEKKAAKVDLKQCSGCRLVRYCSKDCQREHWSMHKKACALGSTTQRDLRANNPQAAEEATAISKWLTFWRTTLFEYGFYAMDLANHPHDRLATHIVFIEFEFREPRERHRLLQMRGGLVVRRERFAEMLREHGFAEASIDAWTADCRGPNVLQISFAIESHVRTLWVGVGDLSQWQDADKALSRRRAQGWDVELCDRLDCGKPSMNNGF